VSGGGVDVYQAFPSVMNAEDFVTDTSFRFQAFIHGGFDHPFESRVQSGAVTAAGKYADTTFFHSVSTGIIESAELYVKAQRDTYIKNFMNFYWTYGKKGSKI
jgi:hypothetical protein